jgi:hypothetical protein
VLFKINGGYLLQILFWVVDSVKIRFSFKTILYKLLNANNLDLMIADYFIFYKKTLGV